MQQSNEAQKRDIEIRRAIAQANIQMGDTQIPPNSSRNSIAYVQPNGKNPTPEQDIADNQLMAFYTDASTRYREFLGRGQTGWGTRDGCIAPVYLDSMSQDYSAMLELLPKCWPRVESANMNAINDLHTNLQALVDIHNRTKGDFPITLFMPR